MKKLNDVMKKRIIYKNPIISNFSHSKIDKYHLLFLKIYISFVFLILCYTKDKLLFAVNEK